MVGEGHDAELSPSELRDLESVALGGICERCRHARPIRSSKGSLFLLCRHPQLPKYPRLPVIECGGFAQRGGDG